MAILLVAAGCSADDDDAGVEVADDGQSIQAAESSTTPRESTTSPAADDSPTTSTPVSSDSGTGTESDGGGAGLPTVADGRSGDEADTDETAPGSSAPESPNQTTTSPDTPTTSATTDGAEPTTASSAATSTTPLTSATTQPVAPPRGAILAVDFESSPLGPYVKEGIGADWPGLRYAKVGDRASIVDEGGNRFVRIRFPQGKDGTDEGGGLWQVDLDGNAADELYVSYRVRFGAGFDFVKGGKLPGLSGGEDNTGGDAPDGNDGWSGRIMWRSGGQAVQYLYHPDQPSRYGEDLAWGVAFTPGRWSTVETRIKMNTPGRNDGIVESWIDGRIVLSRTDIRFRNTDAFNVDSFLFHTFFGGSGPEWAPSRDEIVDFDDVVISGSPITH